MAWSTQGASASRWKYDVFLSFRGENTRKTFTDHLYTALVNAGFRTFQDDDELPRGEDIIPRLEMAIQQSRASVIVFSKDYASSGWCLDELVMILERKRTSDHVVLPVFYDVDPSHVRKQSGSVAKAFARHEKNQSHEKLNRWRAALTQVADLAGMVLQNHADGHESKFINKIVNIIQEKLILAPASRWKYDVFLSFKGEDTRHIIVSHLYRALQNRGINTTMDYRESESLLRAIEESRLAIVVLSPNYASSSWCLDELTKILECSEANNTQVLPLFYELDPSDVRHQMGSFAEAFIEHENSGRDRRQVHRWRYALTKVGNLSGWDSRNYEHESKLVQDIVEVVNYKLGPREIEPIDQKENIETESTSLDEEDFEATAQAVDQTQVSRSQRPYAFLPAPRWKSDVFLSFRGEDTGKSMVSHLYHELENNGFKTFTDDMPLELGTIISSNLQTAIKGSRFAIVVLSPAYASSRWCLDELTICLEAKNTTVLPIFYNVEPSDVRHQNGSFTKSFTDHEERFRHDMKKVNQWRDALNRVASLSGWHAKNFRDDSELIKNIVKFLLKEVQPDEIESWIKHVEATIQVKDQTSEPAPRRKHDVFLSFRGEDTRQNILSHLYHELENMRGLKTFKDDQKLVKGTAISPNLLMAIEESRFAVVLLSANYASSTWCLEELTHILKCMGGKNTILPIFYHVDPSHVRKQEGSFAEAFTNHQISGQDEEKMQQWRDALVKVASFSGWHLDNNRPERELVEDIGKFVWSKVVQAHIDIESAMFTEDFKAFEATKKAMQEVRRALKNDGVSIIGVYGTGGVGKTTMVEHVGVQAQKDGLFNHVFMAFVSRSPDLRKIRDKLAEMLGLQFQEETEMERTRRLKNKIIGAHKILIILDNIWEKIDLSRIGIPSSNELQRCHSKVLLTTRKRDVCQAMRSQEVINLTKLSEGDSLKLFMKQSGKSFESTDLDKVARKVAKQCVGLPIALTAVAKALKDEVLDEWKKVARRLKDSRTANLDDEGDGFNCIKLSYEYLKGEYVKSFLLLCCLFPDDVDIRIADLMEYGYGIGLFHNSNTMQEARATTHLAVKYLKACNLLMDGAEDGCIRMHDVIRDMAMKVLYKDGHHFFPQGEKDDGGQFLLKAGCQLKDWPMDADENYSAISVMRNNICKLPEKLVCSKLQILLLQGNADINDISNTFFQSANAIRVLDLSDTGILLLPPSFNLLTNLCTLYLDGCKSIIDVSALGKLEKLEILSMREFPLKELPKEIGDLDHLRILDFTSESVDTVPCKVLSRLHNLEELYMQCKFIDWSSEEKGAGNAGFDELTGLPYLNILKVNISDADCLPKIVDLIPSWVIFDIRISREPVSIDYSSKPYFSHDHSRTLTLSSTINALPNWFIMSVTKKAESLQYIECNDLKNMLVEYERGISHGLKYLAVIGHHEKMEELMNTTTCVPVPNEPVFESLEELHLVGLFCLKGLCVGELPPRSLCNLKSLKVEDCPNLENTLLPSVFPNLTILVVTCCMKLKSLFTSDVAQFLLRLEELSVVQCPSLDRVIEASEETINKKITFPKLKKLVLCKLPQLTWFYCTGSATVNCPSLEQLYVQDCPQFSTSTSDFHTWEQLVEVNDLRHLRTNNEMPDVPGAQKRKRGHGREPIDKCQTAC